VVILARWSGNFGYIDNPWGDLDQMWLVACLIWWT